MLEQFSVLIVHPACSNLQYGYGVYIFVVPQPVAQARERYWLLRTVLDAIVVDDGFVIISVAYIPFSRLNRTEPNLFI